MSQNQTTATSLLQKADEGTTLATLSPTGERCEFCGRTLNKTSFMFGGRQFQVMGRCPCVNVERKKREQEDAERQKKRRLEALFKQSQLGELFREADFDKFTVFDGFRDVFNKIKKYAENFKRDFKNTSMLLYSPPGTGKTMLAAAVVNHLVKNGTTAIFCVVPDLIMHIKSSFKDPCMTEERLIRGLIQADLLVLDDISAEYHKNNSADDWAASKIFQVVNSRYMNKKATIFTTNCNLNELPIRLGERTFSRMMEMSRGWVFDLSHLEDWRMVKRQNVKGV